MHISFHNQKKIVELICGNGIAKIGGKKNLLQLVCGNAIAEIGEIFFFWQLWQCHCQKWKEKKNNGCRNLGRN